MLVKKYLSYLIIKFFKSKLIIDKFCQDILLLINKNCILKKVKLQIYYYMIRKYIYVIEYKCCYQLLYFFYYVVYQLYFLDKNMFNKDFV